MTAVEAAERGAKAFAARRGRGWAWREYLADAWLGVHADATPHARGAYLGCVDGERAETGWQRRDRAERAAAVGLGAWAAVAPARESRPTPLGVWCEERPARWGWSWRSRVAVYLHCVEGLPVYEAAALLGLSAEAMEKHLNDRLPAWRRRAGVYPGRWPDRYSGAAAVDWDAD